MIRQALVDEPEPVRLLLVVDHLEELFTRCGDAQRHDFLEALLSAAHGLAGRALVVVAVRADFYAHIAEHSSFATVIQDDQVLVGPMSEDELRQAVVRPAVQAGLEVEPALTNEVIGELLGQPGALPLLSHALHETWKKRDGRRLTLAGYVESGGVREAIAQTADNVFAQLSAEQQSIARSIFLRLTELGNATEDAAAAGHRG